MTRLFFRPEITKVLKLQKELDKVKQIFCDEFFAQYCKGIVTLAEYQERSSDIKNYVRKEIATVERLYLFGKHDNAEQEIAGMENRFGFNIQEN